jgi:hypothetical protein
VKKTKMFDTAIALKDVAQRAMQEQMYGDLSRNFDIVKVHVKWSGADHSVHTAVSSRLVTNDQTSGERAQFEGP